MPVVILLKVIPFIFTGKITSNTGNGSLSLKTKQNKHNMQLTFHKANVNIARTSSPSSTASITTHRGITKEIFGVAQITDVFI